MAEENVPQSPELLQKEVRLLYRLTPELDRVQAWYARQAVRALEDKIARVVHSFVKESRWKFISRDVLKPPPPENREITEGDGDDFDERVVYRLAFVVEISRNGERAEVSAATRHQTTLTMTLTNTTVHMNDDLSIPLDIGWDAVIESILEELYNMETFD
jgi:hypothetical protein